MRRQPIGMHTGKSWPVPPRQQSDARHAASRYRQDQQFGSRYGSGRQRVCQGGVETIQGRSARRPGWHRCWRQVHVRTGQEECCPGRCDSQEQGIEGRAGACRNAGKEYQDMQRLAQLKTEAAALAQPPALQQLCLLSAQQRAR